MMELTSNLKLRVAEMLNTDYDSIYLTSGTNNLSRPSARVGDFGITSQSTITVFWRLLGGMFGGNQQPNN